MLLNRNRYEYVYTVTINDRWLLLKPELLWLLIVNALQLNELSALQNTFYLQYKYVYINVRVFQNHETKLIPKYIVQTL